MKAEQVEDIVDGCALLEWYDNLYTMAGKKGDQLMFRSTDDSHFLKIAYSDLLSEPEYSVRY